MLYVSHRNPHPGCRSAGRLVGLKLHKEPSLQYRGSLLSCVVAAQGGCIIRAVFLTDIYEAYKRNPALENLLVDPEFAKKLVSSEGAWRSVVIKVGSDSAKDKLSTRTGLPRRETMQHAKIPWTGGCCCMMFPSLSSCLWRWLCLRVCISLPLNMQRVRQSLLTHQKLAVGQV